MTGKIQGKMEKAIKVTMFIMLTRFLFYPKYCVISVNFYKMKNRISSLFSSRQDTTCFFWCIFEMLSVTFLRTLCDLFDPSRYPPVGRLCHWCHGGRGSDLQHPLHRHLCLQLGPAGRRGRDGWAEQPDKASPSARNSQGTAFIFQFKLLSVRWRADIHTVSGAEIGRTKCWALELYAWL